ncbi:hypothetical protein MARLIPOL_08454 [Marinobacter lipolyticus SM19]|uniref:Uncharacterized protein n=1 Tax=Marinobacter lipolyticus SM19 TaxID=1318628 RepID=R8B2G2_9GAMM|nr:hypothetical protein [Marinobacter lipolyticus]EON92770.1 hypothetical protein MARLIPOL_08454 [Marinobacter lipolyticus SM19]
MPETVCQLALERVLTFLCDSGVDLDSETCRTALRLVDDALTEGDGPDLTARCVDRVPEYFSLPEMNVPLAGPPLERGHIGYYPHD